MFRLSRNTPAIPTTVNLQLCRPRTRCVCSLEERSEKLTCIEVGKEG